MRSAVSRVFRAFPVLDAFVIAVAQALIWQDARRDTTAFLVALLTIPFTQFLFRHFGVYESHRVESIGAMCRRLCSAQVLAYCAAAGALVLLRTGGSLRQLLPAFAASTAALVAVRAVGYTILHAMRRRGIDMRNVCVIGSLTAAQRIAREFAQSPDWGMRVVCVGTGDPQNRRFLQHPSGIPVDGPLDRVLTTEIIDEVLISVPVEQLAMERATVHTCEEYGVLGRVIIEPPHQVADRQRVEEFCGDLCLAFGGCARGDLSLIMKRVFDVLFAAAALLALSPLMAVIAILVKLSSSGPVIFRQTRIGLNGRPFTIYKFRTMTDGADALFREAHRSITAGPTFKDPNDYRVTDIGRWLRRSSLDELPQLLNVLRGDMSFVGPRPLPVYEARAVSGAHRRRFTVLPGITCFWQVSGRSNVTYDAWMQYDLHYVDTWSLWVDTKLLLRTIPVVLSGRGAY